MAGAYDPFLRGPYPVGVRSETLVDPKRGGRVVPLEVWYPGSAQHADEDLDASKQDTFVVLPDGPAYSQAAVRDAQARGGQYPLVVYSHSSGGHRRQSTFLTTHLSSQGYVVAAVEHTGNTAVEFAQRRFEVRPPTPAEMEEVVRELIPARVPDVTLALDYLLSGAMTGEIGEVDVQRIGVAGWSFGGWTALATPETDGRVSAVVAMAPAGATNPLPGIIPAK